MQVQVRHDDVIQGRQQLTDMTVATVEAILDRYAEHITTVEVHYADENGHKKGGGDIRCSVEVRFEGKKPIGVTHHAGDLTVALEAAVEKAARVLDHQFGRARESLPDQS
jgi:hypothetical protein